MKTIAALFLALVLSLCAEERRFIEFEGTASPDGRYAVGWSFPASKKVDWQKLMKGAPDEMMTDEQSKYFDELIGDDARDVENYILEKKTAQPVLTLSDFNHWSFRGFGLNRSAVHAAWTPKSDMVVVAQDARWDQAALTIVILPKEGKPTEQDILNTVERCIENAITKRFAKNWTFKRDREGVIYSFSEFQLLGINRLGLHVYVSPPHSKEDSFTYEADAVFSLRPTKTKGGTSLTCELVSLSSKQPPSANTKTEPLKPAIKAPAR
jgi:hypothetical protein